MTDPQTIAEITTQDGTVTRSAEVYISHGDLFLRTNYDVDGGGPCDLFHIHPDEMIPIACAFLLAHGMLYPVALTGGVQ